MAELITWCRIMRVGPACPTPCDDCRITSRRYNLAGQAGLIETKTLAGIHAEIDNEQEHHVTKLITDELAATVRLRVVASVVQPVPRVERGTRPQGSTDGTQRSR